MNKFLRVLFVLGYHRHVWSDCLPAVLSILYGKSFGIWCFCRLAAEIGIWNVAVLVILIAVNLKYDWFYLRTVLLALILGGLELGRIIYLLISTIICQSMGSVRLKIISSSLVDGRLEN